MKVIDERIKRNRKSFRDLVVGDTFLVEEGNLAIKTSLSELDNESNAIEYEPFEDRWYAYRECLGAMVETVEVELKIIK
jgi:hypothetical protein